MRWRQRKKLWTIPDFDNRRERDPRGSYIGSGIGGFGVIEREHEKFLKGGPGKISPFFIPAAIVNLAAGQVSIRFGAKGPELGYLYRLLDGSACGRR